MSLFSFSLMCVNLFNYEDTIDTLTRDNFDLIHLDIMDGHFVDNFSFSPSICCQIRDRFPSVKFDYHFMTTDPQKHIKWFPIQKGDRVSFHVESISKAEFYKMYNYLNSQDIEVFAAVSPNTEVDEKIGYFLHTDGILILLVRPGFAGQPIITNAIERVTLLSNIALKKNIKVAVDGHVTFELIKDLKQNIPIDTFVLGSSSVFIDGCLSKHHYSKIMNNM